MLAENCLSSLVIHYQSHLCFLLFVSMHSCKKTKIVFGKLPTPIENLSLFRTFYSLIYKNYFSLFFFFFAFSKERCTHSSKFFFLIDLLGWRQKKTPVVTITSYR